METPPPQFSGYTRPQEFVGNNLGRPPGAYLDYISIAWRMIMDQLGNWVAVSLVASVGIYLVSFLQFGVDYLLFGVTPFGDPTAYRTLQTQPLYWVVYFIFTLLVVVVSVTVQVGAQVIALEQFDGQGVQVASLFKPFKRIGALLGSAFFVQIALVIGTLLCIVPGIYAYGVLALAPAACWFQGRPALDSIKYSYEITKPFGWGMLGVAFVAGLASGSGVLLCGIGMLVTYPILPIVLALHWRTFHPIPQQNVDLGNFAAPPR